MPISFKQGDLQRFYALDRQSAATEAEHPALRDLRRMSLEPRWCIQAPLVSEDAVEGILGRRWSTPGASAMVYQALRPDGKLQMEFRVLGSGSAVPEARGSAPDVRKTVTILFVDIVDSSRLSLALDPEALRNLLVRYFDELSAVIRRHGGVVETYIGDAIMAVFGTPIAHEDDGPRAVRAAVEMRDTLAILNREFEVGWGVRLANRIGVNTGEVIAGAQGHLSVAGEAINIAKRLEEAAAANEILIGEPTHQVVRDMVVVEPSGPRR